MKEKSKEMDLKFLYLLFAALMISCASTEKKNEGLEYDAEKEIDVPVWVYSINDDCNNKLHLCASAEGANSLEADLNAKKALASILEVKIKSSSQIKRFGLTSLESKGLTEKVSFDLKEEVDTVLKGAQIIKRFKKEKAYYAYAILEKRPAVKIIKSKIRKIDDKLKSLYAQRKKVFVNRLLALLSERNALRGELLILDGNMGRAPISFGQIYSLKNSSSENELVSIFSRSSIPSNLLERIEEELTSMGFKIVKSKSKSNIDIDFQSSEEYLKVKGFKKYSFILNLKSSDVGGKKLGVLSIKKVSTGRSKEDALRSVLNKILLEIKSNIQKLNI